jgi:hypothetical protein
MTFAERISRKRYRWKWKKSGFGAEAKEPSIFRGLKRRKRRAHEFPPLTRRLKHIDFCSSVAINSQLANEMHNRNVSSAELQRLVVDFLAASAESGGSSYDRRNDDNAFQTLHCLLSSV